MKSKTVLVESLATSWATIYTVPPNTRAKWVLAFVSNGTGSTISNVGIRILNDDTITVLGAKSLGSGDFIQFGQIGIYVMLEPGYTIEAQADTTGVSCILTLEETGYVVSTS